MARPNDPMPTMGQVILEIYGNSEREGGEEFAIGTVTLDYTRQLANIALVDGTNIRFTHQLTAVYTRLLLLLELSVDIFFEMNCTREIEEANNRYARWIRALRNVHSTADLGFDLPERIERLIIVSNVFQQCNTARSNTEETAMDECIDALSELGRLALGVKIAVNYCHTSLLMGNTVEFFKACAIHSINSPMHHSYLAKLMAERCAYAIAHDNTENAAPEFPE